MSAARLALDHVTFAAASLADADAWCDATFGFVPTAGGRHALFGTHNRVFRIDAPEFPQAYGELIAIDPDAAPPGRTRWFGLDDPALQARLRRDGPQLVHWVARCDDLAAVRADFAALDPGEPLAAERMTPSGLLRWTITVRPDGRCLLGGALPALIAWNGPHPCDALAPSGLRLERFAVGGLPDALAARLPPGVRSDAASPLALRIATPRGPVDLHGGA